MNFLSRAKHIFHRSVGQLPPIEDESLNNRPDLLHRSSRSYSQDVQVAGEHAVKKVFATTTDGRLAFSRETKARELFSSYPWFPNWKDKGYLSYTRKFFPSECRLDKLIESMDSQEREACAGNVMSIILDLYSHGASHCDLHAKNFYRDENQLKLVDFETLQFYPAGKRPSFDECYDITGEGLPSPFFTNQMAFASQNSACLSSMLNVSFDVAKQKLASILKEELLQASLSFEKRGQRHNCGAQRIYNSFSIPGLMIDASEAQRDCAKRFEKFGITSANLEGRRVLDLGSNIGGMLMEATMHAPMECVGVEFDRDKVAVARRVAAFASCQNVSFLQADIDQLTVKQLGGPADVTFCLAIEAHVKKNPRLYRLLGKVTREVLYFEGNAGMDPNRTLRLLKKAGFRSIESLGMCDDDAVKKNHNRAMYRASK